MPAADRAALDDALRALPRPSLAPLQFSGIVRINEPRAAAKREIQTVSSSRPRTETRSADRVAVACVGRTAARRDSGKTWFVPP